MTGFISDTRILEVSQAVDIVELVSQYVPLKKVGQNFMGLCPFHKEKSPSFSVSSTKQLYHCFGCGAGGNVFTFVMAHEKVGFQDALRMLARRSGISLPEAPGAEAARDERAPLYAINEWAADVYHQMLTALSASAHARSYVEKRGVSPESVKRFRLGFAPEGWQTLVERARRSDKPGSTLEKAGLIRKASDSENYYDLMRNRLVFPIHDARGRVVGFGGRTLADDTPKYLNTPETPVFSKGRNLYGFNLALDQVSRKRRAGIVEGYTDVIMAHQHGFDWVAGTLGTALTVEHVRFIKRYADEVLLIFDGDPQGLKAAERGFEALIREGLDTRIVVLPEGADPCDFLVARGAEAFSMALSGALDIFRFKIARLRDKYDFADISQKARAVREMVESLALVPDPIKLDLLVTETAREMGVTETAVRAHLRKLGESHRRQERPSERAEPGSEKKTAERRCEEELIGLMLERSDFIGPVKESVGLSSFRHPELEKIASVIYGLYAERGSASPADVAAMVMEPELASCVAGLLADCQGKGKYEERLRRLLVAMTRREKEREVARLREKMQEGNGQRDEKEREELLRQRASLVSELKGGRRERRRTF